MPSSVLRHGARSEHRMLVLRTLLRHGALARISLSRLTGLTPAAISHITRELIDAGLLYEVGRYRSDGPGADAILLDLPEHAPLIGVVHQGVSALRVGLCNLRGRLLAKTVVATPERYSPAWAVATISETLTQLLHEHGYSLDEMVAVGAGLVGLIDAERCVVKRAPGLGWEGVSLREALVAALGRPVTIENNVRAMAVGEALLGRGRGWSDFALVYVGTGLGAGLILNGATYRGAHGGAGELGHITVEPDGELCSCGNRGCLETVAAEPAIVRRARAQGATLDGVYSSTKDAVRALVAQAKSGEPHARAAIASCGDSLGIALADLADLINPAQIVLHGVITEAGPLFFDAVRRSLEQHAFLAADEHIQLALPTFGEDAGLVGAGAVALDKCVFSVGDETLLSLSAKSEVGA